MSNILPKKKFYFNDIYMTKYSSIKTVTVFEP